MIGRARPFPASSAPAATSPVEKGLHRRGHVADDTTFTGTGALAVTAFGTPVVLNVDVPTYVDMQSAVLWSTSLRSSIRRTAKLAAAIGRGSGEAYQLALSGQGIVVVQASEGHPPPAKQ